MTLQEIGNPPFIALESFRQNGTGVITPVWVMREAEKLYVWTSANSWKVKRIRRNPRVRLAVSDARGRPKSGWVEARATVLQTPEAMEAGRRRALAKYGLQFRLISLLQRLQGQAAAERAVLEISQAT